MNPLDGVSRETILKLEAYADRLRHWQTRINLVSPSTLPDLWSRHIVDSAQLLQLAPPSWTRWVDLGSGGGLPGAIVAIMTEGTDRVVHLVESNTKKASFLVNVLGDLAPTARVHRMRIEHSHTIVGDVDVLSARALAGLSELLDLAEPWLSHGALGLFPKGRGYADEIAEARDGWQFSLVEDISVTDADSRILTIRDARRAERS
jgi:16S rRNA (guanine527-N7)-methyltransferase